MESLLAVCIPTFNRKDRLQKCLDTLIPQAQEYGISIYISDNASTDGTDTLIATYQGLYPKLFYKRYDVNSGLDINMLRVMEMADSKYAWWLGDDDIITEDGIKHVVEILQHKELSFVLLNAKFAAEYSKNEKPKTTIKATQNISHNDCVSFFRRHCFDMPFGTLVVNTKLFQGLDYSRFLGTSHAYSGAVLDYLAQEFHLHGKIEVLVLSSPYVTIGHGEKTWSKHFADIHLLQIPQWFDNLLPIYRSDADHILKKYIKRMGRFRILWKIRRIGQMNETNVHELTKRLPFTGRTIARVLTMLPITTKPQVNC